MSNELKFPRNFMCGTATASYQVEGAVNEGGRGDSVWDAISRTPGKVLNGDTGEKAVGHYHQSEKDVQLIKNMALKAYCLAIAIAWLRTIPADIGMVNEEGVELYNNVINELLANSITPLTEYDGWLGAKFIKDAFAHGIHAPGRKCKLQTEAYLAGHNLLLAHARAKVKTQEAAERSVLFWLHWFADPVYKGDYPQVLKYRCGLRLPKFTEEAAKLLQGSSDFFGLNHYGTNYTEPSERSRHRVTQQEAMRLMKARS
ncbi:hypothetical protein JG688_00016651 [Phytophthora aleatoria]|uniref:Glycoside hydrolase n=1 Tax=Phytophthora aleatoria TaxID=2496075 RepID=A0A8J5MCA6_9STRA|nr:hypothetical protein JG688_00016651 [Phytophthora aleatoria]